MISPSDCMLEDNLGGRHIFEDLYATAPIKNEPSLGKLPPPTKYVVSDSETDDAEDMPVKVECDDDEDVLPSKRKRPSSSMSGESDSDVEALLNSLPKSKAGRKKKRVTSNMTKNALAARENRERKKKYIEDLEALVRNLNAENKSLKKKQQDDHDKIASLSQTVKYYTSVISNIDEIKQLVNKVSHNPMNTPPADHDYGIVESKPAGICLHVAGNKMALKVCAKCSISENSVL